VLPTQNLSLLKRFLFLPSSQRDDSCLDLGTWVASAKHNLSLSFPSWPIYFPKHWIWVVYNITLEHLPYFSSLISWKNKHFLFTNTFKIQERSSNTMASLGDELAIGIDLGTTYSCVAVWQHDRVEIIANDQGNRTTPSYVSFTKTERLIGEAAKNDVGMNPTNTVFGALFYLSFCFCEV
jgi:Hsp70 protein